MVPVAQPARLRARVGAADHDPRPERAVRARPVDRARQARRAAQRARQRARDAARDRRGRARHRGARRAIRRGLHHREGGRSRLPGLPRHPGDPAPAASARCPIQSTAPRSTFRLLAEGFVVGITNPKTIAFFVAVLPQFVAHDAGAIPLQLAELGLIFFVLALIMDGIWALHRRHRARLVRALAEAGRAARRRGRRA